MASEGKIAAYDMFSCYKYLIVSVFFSHLGFWSGNLFLFAPFPDLCLLVPFYLEKRQVQMMSSRLGVTSKQYVPETQLQYHYRKNYLCVVESKSR